MRHAGELRVPLGAGARLLTPHLVTTTRRVDKVKDPQGSTTVLAITEHYLSYAYELITVKPGPMGVKVIMLYGGGTLVLDENWKAVLLATDPPAQAGDPAAPPENALSAIQRERERFESVRRRAGSPLSGERNGHVNGAELPAAQPSPWPFLLLQEGAGPARFVRRRCNLLEHQRGIARQQAMFPFATRRIEVPVTG
jgi:hypothetical protein